MLRPKARLKFSGNRDKNKDLSAQEDLSAVACFSSDHLVIGGDEGHAVDVLKREPDGNYALEQNLVLVDVEQDEADIEDICCIGSTCYVIGSHSRKRKTVKPDEKSYKKNRTRLFKSPKPEPTRAVLFRLEVNSETFQVSLDEKQSLEGIIAGDELLEQFIRIPSKENGIDIEGLAIKDGELYVGFRSPVLRDNYVPILVLNAQDFQKYALRFIQMGGRGIRAMTETKEGFLVLGGPPGDGEGTYDVYFWDGSDMIPGKDIPPILPLQHLATLETPEGSKAEGLALLSEESAEHFEVIVVYDGIVGGNPSLFHLPKPDLSR